MTKIPRIAFLPTLLVLAAGCASQRPPRTDFHPCQRVEIERAPLWTASAAWTPAEDHLLLIGPGTHSLLLYNLEGDLERQVDLDPLAALDYASPVRLQATVDGYFVGDKTQILWLDHDLEKQRLWKPLEHLARAGVAGGSLSDFTVVGETVYAYADWIRESEWYRGFVRIDLEKPEYSSLHEFAVEDREPDAYYFYSKRPYVTDLGKRAYVLRYQDPPQVFRSTRDELRPLFAAEGSEDLEITSLYGWKGRLYLLGWRRAERPGEEKAEEPVEPELLTEPPSHAQLLSSQRSFEEGDLDRFLLEIDPKSGKRLRQIRLPTESGSVKLLPGKSYWALIEESDVPNIDGKESTHLTLLPSSWFQGGRAAAAEVVLECPAG